MVFEPKMAAGWPVSPPGSIGITLTETWCVIWTQLIHADKRPLIKSQVRVFTNSFVTISHCCLQCWRQVQGELAHSVL